MRLIAEGPDSRGMVTVKTPQGEGPGICFKFERNHLGEIVLTALERYDKTRLYYEEIQISPAMLRKARRLAEERFSEFEDNRPHITGVQLPLSF